MLGPVGYTKLTVASDGASDTSISDIADVTYSEQSSAALHEYAYRSYVEGAISRLLVVNATRCERPPETNDSLGAKPSSRRLPAASEPTTTPTWGGLMLGTSA